MAIIQILDHQNRAKARLPGFMQGAVNIEAFLDAINAETQFLETTLFQLLDERHLTVAVGTQLDGIGQILDLDRIVGQSDASYRNSLIARTGELAKGGEIETLITVMTDLITLTSPDSLVIQEPYPATLSITHITDTDAQDPIEDAELVAAMGGVRASGVQLFLIRAGLTNSFEFSDESEVVSGNGPIDSDRGFGDEALSGGGGLSRRI